MDSDKVQIWALGPLYCSLSSTGPLSMPHGTSTQPWRIGAPEAKATAAAGEAKMMSAGGRWLRAETPINHSSSEELPNLLGLSSTSSTGWPAPTKNIPQVKIEFIDCYTFDASPGGIDQGDRVSFDNSGSSDEELDPADFFEYTEEEPDQPLGLSPRISKQFLSPTWSSLNSSSGAIDSCGLTSSDTGSEEDASSVSPADLYPEPHFQVEPDQVKVVSSPLNSQGIPLRRGIFFSQTVLVADMSHVLEDSTQVFIDEMDRYLREIRHHNLLLMMGYTISPNSFITEDFGAEDVWRLRYFLDNPLQRITGEQMIDILSGISQGMNYLHTRDPPLLHKNLTPESVRLDGTMTQIKLGDFDYGGIGRSDSLKAWEADSNFTEKSDVYSFGVLMWECLTKSRALDRCREQEFEYHGQKKVERVLEIPDYAPPFAEKLLVRCWRRQPTRRPAYKRIVKLFSRIKTLNDKTRQNVGTDLVERTFARASQKIRFEVRPGNDPDIQVFYTSTLEGLFMEENVTEGMQLCEESSRRGRRKGSTRGCINLISEANQFCSISLYSSLANVKNYEKSMGSSYVVRDIYGLNCLAPTDTAREACVFDLKEGATCALVVRLEIITGDEHIIRSQLKNVVSPMLRTIPGYCGSVCIYDTERNLNKLIHLWASMQHIENTFKGGLGQRTENLNEREKVAPLDYRIVDFQVANVDICRKQFSDTNIFGCSYIG
ncbi:hypothetical protein PROFUN_10740 [Planoprotostelium fungivorum]|uniref:Protein kinase domain-containing protein n=1 Tax=Planoprotostelium fungivorum TaxID=1890364 RepID=A0A2P6N7Y5_9EUKA|nr:hypothetical protein PROFUN_10740 [Planoprotostelium fungivorum]